MVILESACAVLSRAVGHASRLSRGYLQMKPNSKILIAGLGVILSFAFLYHNAFVDLLGHWNGEDFSYCYLAPLIAGYLVYTDRQRLRSVPLKSSWWGLLVLGVAGMLFLAVRMGSLETIVYLSIWVTVIGITLTFFGPELLKRVFFPW
ncbi:MAG: archaeosortase/exosortase family protein [Candidatus Subteraquimicrobiales bacterium]|nr:archaeosortase/exosortase family protein [Candidatus Subteraquimicrobiales bacterium]